MAIESLFDEDLEWHPGLTDEQILEAKSKGIYEPFGPEYEQFLSEVGIDKNNLNDEGIVTEDKAFIENNDPLYSRGWHPDLTQEQILYALEKDIYEPVGQEYEQFLKELGLEPVKRTGGPIPPPPPHPPYPHDPDPPYIPTGGTRGGGTKGRGTDSDDPELEDPRRKPKPPIGGTTGGGNGGVNPPTDDDPVFGEEPEKDDPNKKPKPPTVGTPSGGSNPPTDDDPVIDEDEPKKEEEEETYHVVRVERRDKCHIPLLLVATALAFTLVSGSSIDKPLKPPTTVTRQETVINYQFEEQVREMVYQDKMVENIIYSFLAEKDISIGDRVDVGKNTPAYYYGNLTGRSTTISGEQAITGFCLYSPDNENIKYEYSFYEDRALDGTPDRTSVQGIEQKVNVSLDEFLAQLDTANYNLDDIRFSLHFGQRGWVDASELIKVNGAVTQSTIQELVEVVKQGATYSGTVKADVDFVNIAQEGKEAIWVKITDDDTDELFPSGTIVEASDGKQYVISSLERETIETEHVIEGEEGPVRLKWSIMDCNLALGLSPLVAAAAIAVANKMKNDKNKENPDFFEFENDEDYLKFKSDFEKAREEYRSVSKFGNVLKRIFIGEKYHISTDLTEEQVEEMYTTIRNSNTEDYTYKPTDQIRIMEGQVFAVHEDGSKTNITKTVSHIGKDNPEGTKGLLTDEIVETHGGGKKV